MNFRQYKFKRVKPGRGLLVYNYINIKNMATEKDDKLGLSEITGLLVIALILLYFPYKMISGHARDVTAMSYYHEGK